MDERRLNRLGAWGGFGYIALMLIAWIVFWQTNVFTTFGETPDTDASATEIATFYAKHRTEQLTAGTTWALALLPLVVFLSRLRAVLGRTEGGDGTVTNLFTFGAVAFLVAPIIWVGGVLGVAFRAGETDPAVSQYNADLFILPVSASAPVWAGMFFAIALIILRFGPGTLPRWLGRFAIVTGLCQFFYLGTPYQPSGIWWSSNQGILVAYLAYGSQLGWIVACSVHWLRAARRPAGAASTELEGAAT
jgi:hypothetical protein